MITHSDSSNQQVTWQQYKDNLPRYLIALSRYLQSSTMHQLQENGQHPTLKLSFEPFISLITAGDYRLTDLAEHLAISKQACNQTANQIEKAGYIQRIPDPADGRAKMITLTKAGHQLVEQGSQAILQVIENFQEQVDEQELLAFTESLNDLALALHWPRSSPAPRTATHPLMLGTLLPRSSNYVMQKLMTNTINRGHPGLKMSHGAVLSLIGLNGGRIQQIARIQDVSKQAISAIAKDLEELGYIVREADTNDTRQSLLRLSEKGLSMIEDSVIATEELENECIEIIGHEKLAMLKSTAKILFDALALESESSNNHHDLNKLAIQLKQQLGGKAAKELGELLRSA